MSNNNETSLIINVVNFNLSDTYLVFDSDTVTKLREKYRICGRLIGFIASKQSITTSSYLPLKLNKFEFDLLCDLALNEKNLIQILKTNYKNLPREHLLCLKIEYDKYIEQFKERKKIDYIKLRRDQLILMRDKIIDGKRKKLTNQLRSLNENDERRSFVLNQLDNLELDFNVELDNIQFSSDKNDDESSNTEIFTKTPEFYSVLFKKEKILNFNLESIVNDSLKTAKFKCYKHFWSKGFYLTCGAKFGGDFLAYAGDPSHYHAQFIIVAIENEHKLKMLKLKNLITYGRMATSVKKTFVVAYEYNSELKFVSLNWSHF